MARFNNHLALRARAVPLLAALAVWALASAAQAQFVGGAIQQVGGVWIDPSGLLRNREVDETNKVRAAREKIFHAAPVEMQGLGLRKISLARLQAAILEHRQHGAPLDDEMKYLAGLQRIQYVFVYPEQNDIVLAGPAEGWKLNEQGEVVGVTTGRPVMWIDDLITALRTAKSSRQTGLSCSIDPTNEGIVKLRGLVPRLIQEGTDIREATAAIEESLGPQNIRVTGVPGDSHFARVMVAADYKMKRLAMHFDPSPIKGLPSFLTLMKAGPKGMSNMLPRWWLEPNYESLLASPDGLGWEFRGAGVKAMTEEDFVTANGARQGSGKANPVAKKWADNMTAHYDELSAKDVVFGQLRNCIDLAVVSALIVKDHLPEKADCDLSLLLDDPKLAGEQFVVPTQVASQASVLQKGSNWLISASGGVQISGWGVAAKSEESPTVAPERAKSLPQGNTWWWN